MTLQEIRDAWPEFITRGWDRAVYGLTSAQINAINAMGELLHTPGSLAAVVLASCHPDSKSKSKKGKAKRGKTRTPAKRP